MKRFNRVLAGFGLGLLLTGVGFAGGETGTTAMKREKRAQRRTEIKVETWGRTQSEVDAANARIERSSEVQKELAGTRYRRLESSYIETEVKGQPSAIPNRLRVVFYDYTNDRTIVAEGGFDASAPVTVKQEFYQPNPNNEEFAEALRILQSDARFGNLMRGDRLRTFRPMPPVSVISGTTERLVNVGIEGADNSAANEVVSVSVKRAEVIRYDKRAPETSASAPDACGIPAANQSTTSRGTAGQYQMVVTDGTRTPLWEMLVIRPAASSGTMASGIEIRDVKYKGKSVLKRGHAPVLNVQYVPRAGEGTCGPYRDWQYEEGAFSAPATGATYPNGASGGIVVLADGQTATTSLETGSDSGNFRGVAIYKQNNEIVMVSEMEAGWYRYIMEWRFANDGTIRPRYGFGATNNSCVCYRHNHHVFWRFDFDVVNPNNKVFQMEKGRKFLQPLTTEAMRLKNVATNRSLLIQNATGDEAYMLVPNITDGEATFKYENGTTTDFGRSDMWILKYKNVAGGSNLQNEIDDGYSSVGGNCTTTSGACININQFVNNESIVNQDVVVWYGAHFVHADGNNVLNPDRNPTVLSGLHVVGPDLRPVRW